MHPIPSYSQLIDKLVLGTVQFGTNYGIANESGKLSEKEVGAILSIASKYKIKTLDTASDYGDSEALLARVLKDREIAIISKLPNKPNLEGRVESCLYRSFEQLKQKSLYAYLVHGFQDWKTLSLLFLELNILKEKGFIQKTGISLYHPKELDVLIENNAKFDILQVPYNLFDRRFESYFPMLKELGVEVHVRSVFLQGLFFLSKEKLRTVYPEVEERVLRLQYFAEAEGVSLNALCLCFTLNRSTIDKVLVGVTSPKELEANIVSLGSIKKVNQISKALEGFYHPSEEVITPLNWL